MQGQVFGGCKDGLIMDSALLPGSEDIPLLPSSSQQLLVLRQSQKLSMQARPYRCPPLLPNWAANILTADSHWHTPFHPAWLLSASLPISNQASSQFPLLLLHHMQLTAMWSSPWIATEKLLQDLQEAVLPQEMSPGLILSFPMSPDPPPS